MTSVTDLTLRQRIEALPEPVAFRHPEKRFGTYKMSITTLVSISVLLHQSGLAKSYAAFIRAMAKDAEHMIVHGHQTVGYADELFQWYLDASGGRRAYEALSKIDLDALRRRMDD